MDAPDPSALDPEVSDQRIAGPLILGVPWPVPHELVRTAARLAAGMDLHLVCAYVGGGRAGILPRITRALEGSVSVRLTRIQDRPVVVVPEHTVRPRETEPGETRSTPPTVE